MRASTRFFAVLSLVAGCGAGSATAPEPRSAAPREDASLDEGATSSGDTSADAEASETSAAAAGPSCDDGTCSPCGSGICPAGWYCDERAGGACSWLAECTQKPTCACVTRVLGAGCKCREESGGLKVACD